MGAAEDPLAARRARPGAPGSVSRAVLAKRCHPRAAPLYLASVNPNPPESRIRATFEVRGKFDPDAFTAATGLRPTSTFRAGTPFGQTRTKIDGWTLSTTKERGWDLTPHIERILAQVVPRQAAIRAFLAANPEAEAIVFGVSEISDVSPAVVLSPEVLRSIADLGACFEFDQSGP